MHYNPLRHSNYTELKDKLITITKWTEPHYKLVAEIKENFFSKNKIYKKEFSII